MSPKKIALIVAAVAVLAAGAVGGASLAGAATKSPSGQGYGEGPRGWGGGHGPGGGSQDTPVTGSEKAKVEAAVKAKYSSVTVQSVRKDPDGSYDVFGTKAGAPVMYDVSKDLKTITEHTGGPGKGHGDGPPPGAAAESSS